MNFLSHYFLDRAIGDSLFLIGVSTPDLLTLYRRDQRLSERKLPTMPDKATSPRTHSFLKGIKRHFSADAAFHSSHFFEEFTKNFAQSLRVDLPEAKHSRPSFISHITTELLLDRVLIQAEPDLVDSFYAHYAQFSTQSLTLLTEWAAGVPLPDYRIFLDEFLRQQILYRYVKWDYLLYILHRIVEGVGLPTHFIQNDPAFLGIIQEQESKLARIAVPELRKLATDLGPAFG